ncbi:MAG: repeat domain in Vibrio, Colwellia, Bradyrhizobium and Shewanella [Bacteroidota bacterium]|nr:repeat domain in Vibrio, Colwellia, Bradyrhizobium and Shewanella [Bacteroidota bacterium]
MSKFLFSFLLLFLVKSNFAVNEYQLKSNDCYGNNDDDNLGELYPLNDSTDAAILVFQNKNGYFASAHDSSTWIVKFDKRYKVSSKTLINNKISQAYFYDAVTQSVCFLYLKGSSNTVIAGLEIYSITDASKKLSISLNDSLEITQWPFYNFYVNPNGGYILKYSIQHPASIDSVKVIVIDSTLTIWCNKTLPTNYFNNTYMLLDSTKGVFTGNHHWMSDVFFDQQYLYSASFVHDSTRRSNDGFNKNTAVIMQKLDKSLTLQNTAVIDYVDSIGGAQLNNSQSGTFFKFGKNNLIYKQQLSEESAEFYLFDTLLQVKNKAIPPNNGNKNKRYFFREFTSGNKLYFPGMFRDNSSAPSLSDFFCYDENLNLIHHESLDSSFGHDYLLSANVVDHLCLADSSILLTVWGIYNGIYNRHYMKVDKNGQKVWISAIPDTCRWKNKLLQTQYSDTYSGIFYSQIPAIETIYGKERAVTIFAPYLDRNFNFQIDTTVLTSFKINLENGKIIDTSFVSAVITTNNLKKIYFNSARKIENHEYAVIGLSNQLCTGRMTDIFSGIASRNYNTVVSRVFLDLNSNSILDGNEHYLSNVSIKVTKNTVTTTSYFSDSESIINFIDTGSYQVKVDHNINYFSAVPTSATVNHTSYGNVDSLLFALQPVVVVNDLVVELNNNGRGIPGFNGSYILNAINNGTTVQDVILKLKLTDKIDSIVSSPSALMNNDTLFWNFNSFEPNEQKTVVLHFHYKTPPQNNIGDTLISTALITPLENDTFPSNNISVLYDVLSGSYDPNDKITDKDIYTAEDLNRQEYIKYTIHFENTGNDTTFFVVVLDTLDNSLDPSTFIPLKGEYSYTTKISQENIVTFTFNPIHLSPHTTTSVSYLVKPKNIVANGSTIKNRASVFFDYNLPVFTNSTQTSISLVTGLINEKHPLAKFKIYPDPAKNIITVEFADMEMVTSLQVIDMLGHIKKNITVNSNDKFLFLDVSAYPSGLYFLNVAYHNRTSQAAKFSIIK